MPQAMGILKKIFFNLLDSTFEGLENADSKSIVVVSFFGKTFWDSDGCKYEGFRSLTRRNEEDQKLPQVNGLYNPESHVLYLQLTGILDVSNLLHILSSSAELNDKCYLSIWADLKIDYAKTLYLLVSVSHILVLCHPVAAFDTSYLHLFKSLDMAREACTAECSQAISHLKLANDCKESGRLCAPRVLFRFFSSPPRVKDVTQLEHALEDQIYELMKKHKFVANSSGSSLFSIPANQEFVFIETAAERPGGRLIRSVQDIVKKCNRPESLGSPAVQLDRLTIDYDLQQETAVHKFENFLQTHIDVVATKGLDDNIGRHSHKNHCFLPTLKQWADIVRALHPITAMCPEKKTCSRAIRSCIDIDRQFSEGRCAKVLPLALAAYQENAPPHYPRRYHESKLAHALSVLAVHGRGAMLDQYVTHLERQCNEHWRSGRQMCETLSLTGHPCINALHKGGGDGAGGGELKHSDSVDGQVDDDRKLPENLEDKEHCSGVRYISACNCGRKQGARPDPYTLKAANFEFYRSLASECGCDKLENYKFPVFQPSVKDYRAAQLLGRRESLALIRGDAPRSQVGGGTQHEAFSLAFVSGSVHGSCDVVETRLSCLRTQHPDILILTNQPGEIRDKDKSLVRQASTTEYLPGMLHAESPSGLLPQYGSWSLLCVGASSVYSHNLGLHDQPGLVSGSSYLLPWDVTVRLEHQKKNFWPTVSDTKRVGAQFRARKYRAAEQSEMLVKIFVGVEYECTRGHRFMTANPDKVLKTGPSGQVRETGHKIASSDMPLYFPCPCSKPSKPVVAQLMRLHVVTPKAPVRVTLNPKVQPAPNAPIFIGCHDQPIPLSPSTYWVMRLPYVYMTERSPFVAPLELPNLQYGRLLAGAFGISEIPPDRTS